MGGGFRGGCLLGDLLDGDRGRLWLWCVRCSRVEGLRVLCVGEVVEVCTLDVGKVPLDSVHGGVVWGELVGDVGRGRGGG